MKNLFATILVAALAILSFMPLQTLGADDIDNPKNTVATASGNNTVLAVPDGKRCRVHSATFVCTKGMTASVGLYVKDGTHNLIGSATALIPIDKTGINGPPGITIESEKYGIMVTQTAGDDIVVNLDAAQPVIVILVFSYF